MTRLEQRYRRLLRVLPAWYRVQREREMVDVFLESRADEAPSADLGAEYGWPGWSETAAVAALAVRTRVGGEGAPPGPRAVGDAVRAAAVLAVLVNAAGAAAGVLGRIVAMIVGSAEAQALTDDVVHPVGVSGWWGTVVFLLSLYWLPAWTALTSGRRRTALLLALGACVPSVVGVVTGLGDDAGSFVVLSLAPALVELATLVLLLVGFHRDAALPTVARPWTLLAGATTVLGALGGLVLALGVQVEPVTAVLLLVAVVLALTGRRGALPAGVAVLGAVTALAGLLTVAALEVGRDGAMITTVLGVATVLVAAWATRRPSPDTGRA